MNFRLKSLFFAVAFLFFSSQLFSAVFINGVKIPQMKDQIFDSAEVIFNQDGDIHIYAKGVMLVPENATAKNIENRYYIILKAPDINKIAWLFFNGKEFQFDKSRSMIPQEITSLLQKGQNTLTVRIPKGEKADKLSIILGKGTQIEGKFEITPIVEYNIKLTVVENFKVFTFELENK